MPVYEFRCSTCHAVFDERRPMADADAPATCPGRSRRRRAAPARFATTGHAAEPVERRRVRRAGGRRLRHRLRVLLSGPAVTPLLVGRLPGPPGAEFIAHPATSDRNFYDRYYFNMHPCSGRVVRHLRLRPVPEPRRGRRLHRRAPRRVPAHRPRLGAPGRPRRPLGRARSGSRCSNRCAACASSSSRPSTAWPWTSPGRATSRRWPSRASTCAARARSSSTPSVWPRPGTGREHCPSAAPSWPSRPTGAGGPGTARGACGRSASPRATGSARASWCSAACGTTSRCSSTTTPSCTSATSATTASARSSRASGSGSTRPRRSRTSGRSEHEHHLIPGHPGHRPLRGAVPRGRDRDHLHAAAGQLRLRRDGLRHRRRLAARHVPRPRRR